MYFESSGLATSHLRLSRICSVSFGIWQTAVSYHKTDILALLRFLRNFSLCYELCCLSGVCVRETHSFLIKNCGSRICNHHLIKFTET
jgi:hypothetical protein